MKTKNKPSILSTSPPKRKYDAKAWDWTHNSSYMCWPHWSIWPLHKQSIKTHCRFFLLHNQDMTHGTRDRAEYNHQRTITNPVHNSNTYIQSDWVIVAEPFQLHHGENKSIFNEMMRSALFTNNTLSCIFIVIAHWNNNSWAEMSLHSDTLFWFWAKQSLLLLPNAACLVEKQHIPI